MLRDLHVRQAHQSQPLRELPGAAIGQYVTYRHKRQQPHYCNDDYHDDHTWIAEAFARNHQSGGDVAFPGTKRQCPSRINTRPAEHPTHAEPQCNQEQSGEDAACAEDMENLVDIRHCEQQHHRNKNYVGNPVERGLHSRG